MSHKEVYTAVSTVVPCRHVSWGDEKKPKLPWAVYYTEDRPMGADDEMWAIRHDWTVELYEERRDAALEKKLGDAINQAFGPYRKDESWVKSESLLMVTYTFHEIEGA